ncbi:squalene synthase HpnC [Comamonas serinivorans]|uniref:Squalene synthase HpnC n=1 Tax=Comamonas serinivorans TaxID=1082851 RepID=A0A1Y0EJT6_9BURK|nr:squalene synthase HpnC [Comamonas serinivorans]ARU03903.1 squalene synthase HpnC [Comamonas serinivorans]
MTQHTPIAHYENFPVASWLCPAALRPHVAAIYHFARTADDLADEGQASADERLAQLARYRHALDRLYPATQSPPDGVCHDSRFSNIGNDAIPPSTFDSTWPHIFEPLQRSVAAVALPQQPLADLLTAFEHDVANTRDARIPADREALLAYCRHSANPVGRLLLHLYGVHDAAALKQSDAICSALQLINFWQDLSQDIPRGRHYIPHADRQRFGLTPAEIDACVPSPAVGAFVADACRWTRALMQSGAPLVHCLPGRAGWELRAVVQGGLRMLDHVQALGPQAIAQRKKLGTPDWLRVAWRTLRM